MGKITIIGSINMDLVVCTPKIPIMGETVIGEGFMTAPGGKGANQAVAAARLGGQVSMVGCVGDDIFGKNLTKNLSKNNVSIRSIKTIQNKSTGIAVIVIKEGDNFIIVDPGANHELTPTMIDDVEDLIKESSIIVLQLEIPMESVKRAIKIAKKNKVKVLLNPAPAQKLDDRLLADVDIITPNETESEIITGIPIRSVDDAKKAVEYLKKKGIPQVIVTMGKHGVVYNSGTDIINKPVPDVEVVDTTAAGDSFTGALSVAITEGKTIDEAIDFANIVGTLTVTKKGAQTSLPTIEDVHSFMNS